MKIVDNKKGFALIMIAIALMIGVIFMSALYVAAIDTGSLFIRQYQAKRAYYNAVSGVEYSLYLIKAGIYDPLTPAGSPPSGPRRWPDLPPDGSIGTPTIIGDNPANPTYFDITCTGNYSGMSKTIKARYDVSARTISDWRVQ